jgi:hypothetical protein
LPRGEPNWEVPTIVTVNPLHTMSSASSAWTTVNIGEAFPGLHFA